MVVAERILPDSYYDDADLEHLYEIPVVFKNPTYRQRKEIELLKTLYRGIMLVTGKARSGKDLYGTSFSFLNKLYFGRPIMLDFKPRRLFGEYIPFNPAVLMNEINKMAKVSSLSHLVNIDESMSTEQEEAFDHASKDWLQDNEIQFQNAILYLSELKRYCYNRNPHNRMNKFIGHLCDIHGHLNLLVLGTHIDYTEIDKHTFLKNVSFWANCEWSMSRLNNTRVTIKRGSYITELGNFDCALKDIIYWVDGATPRDFLDGDCLFHLYNTQNLVNLKPVMTKEVAQ